MASIYPLSKLIFNAQYNIKSQAFFDHFSNIGDCCPGYNTNCVIMGAMEAEVTTFPREAMMPLQPYPFGLDPVSQIICTYSSLGHL